MPSVAQWQAKGCDLQVIEISLRKSANGVIFTDVVINDSLLWL